jgi:glutathione S-transferase
MVIASNAGAPALPFPALALLNLFTLMKEDTMKLFYAAGACSLSPHIVLREAGLNFEIERVDFKTKQTAGGTDYLSINPKGSVPALQLDDGAVLTEGPAIVQYLADQAPAKKLAPANGTFERYQLMEILNYLTSEVHKTFGPLFNPKSSDEAKAAARTALAQRFAYLDKKLAAAPFLTGEQFTVADAYLFVLLSWTGHVGIDLSPWPATQAYQKKVAARPAVQAAMVAEGLIKHS